MHTSSSSSFPPTIYTIYNNHLILKTLVYLLPAPALQTPTIATKTPPSQKAFLPLFCSFLNWLFLCIHASSTGSSFASSFPLEMTLYPSHLSYLLTPLIRPSLSGEVNKEKFLNSSFVCIYIYSNFLLPHHPFSHSSILSNCNLITKDNIIKSKTKRQENGRKKREMLVPTGL